MKQAIAGVVPPEVAEVTSMTIWPSIAMYPSGRFLGRLYNIRLGMSIFRLGNFLVLASIPHALALYVYRILPYVGTKYRLTNRRVIVERGLLSEVDKSVELDRFDRVEIDVRPGQEWFKSGDLVFYHGDTETFRLDSVSRPEAFLEVCVKANMSCVGVKEALRREAAMA